MDIVLDKLCKTYGTDNTPEGFFCTDSKRQGYCRHGSFREREKLTLLRNSTRLETPKVLWNHFRTFRLKNERRFSGRPIM